MKNFKLRSLDGWNLLALDEIVEFEVHGNKSRAVSITLNASEGVEVYISEHPEMEGMVLWGASDGMFSLEVATIKPVYVVVRAANLNATVFMKTRMQDHTIRKMSEEEFTTIEKREQIDPNMARMMAIMQWNEKQRDAKLKKFMQDKEAVLDNEAVQAEAERVAAEQAEAERVAAEQAAAAGA